MLDGPDDWEIIDEGEMFEERPGIRPPIVRGGRTFVFYTNADRGGYHLRHYRSWARVTHEIIFSDKAVDSTKAA